MTHSCRCGSPGHHDRQDLARHVLSVHGTSTPAALLLADRMINKLTLSPEDCAVLGIDAAPINPRPRVVAAAEQVVQQNGLPDDAALNRTIAAAADQFASPAPAPKPPRRLAVATAPTPPIESPAPKETAMADISTPIPCKGCKKPFIRKHPREAYCSTDCKAGRPKAPRAKKAKAPKKPTGGGKRSKSARKVRAVREPASNGLPTDNALRARAVAFLGDLRKLRARLDEKITHVEELATLL